MNFQKELGLGTDMETLATRHYCAKDLIFLGRKYFEE